MIYTRAEIVGLVYREPKELQPILIAIIWMASQCDANLITDNRRYGLTQLDLRHAILAGFCGHPNQLLDPPRNIEMASHILQNRGLIDFLGRDFAPQYHAIVALSRELAKPLIG